MQTSNPGPSDVRRILSLDGGGIKGTFSAAFLAALEEDLEHPIGKYFDLIAGTSTGGILALGLALGKRASELLSLYERHGPFIFGKSSTKLQRFIGSVRHLFKPKHNADNLRNVLETILGDSLVANAQTRLVVPAWDPDRSSPYIYKTAHHRRFSTDYKASMLDVAMATAAAPTYFKRHITVDGIGLVDGGIWANNPIAVATVEALSILNWNRDEIYILSLGGGSNIELPEESGGLSVQHNISDIFMEAQSHGALGMAKHLTYHSCCGKRIHRHTPIGAAASFSLDDPSKIDRLKGIGKSEARSAKPHLMPVFFKSPAEKFVPEYRIEGMKP